MKEPISNLIDKARLALAVYIASYSSLVCAVRLLPIVTGQGSRHPRSDDDVDWNPRRSPIHFGTDQGVRAEQEQNLVPMPCTSTTHSCGHVPTAKLCCKIAKIG